MYEVFVVILVLLTVGVQANLISNSNTLAKEQRDCFEKLAHSIRRLAGMVLTMSVVYRIQTIESEYDKLDEQEVLEMVLD